MCFLAVGLFCDQWQRKCQHLVARGGACEDSEACVSGNYCSDEGRCITQKAKGEACQDYAECGAKMYCSDGTCSDLSFAFPDLCEGDYD
ncbi:MAG: Dickkopf N-terminal cysteine-rich domain-containing protein [Myxococcales bacterium]